MVGTIVYAALTIVMANLAFGVVLWLRVRKLYSYPGVLGFPVIGNLYNVYKTLLMYNIDRGVKYALQVAEEHGKDGLFFHWLFGYSVAAVITSPELVKKLAFHPNLADKAASAYKGFKVCMEGPFSDLRSDDVWKQKRKDYNYYLKKSRVETDYHNSFIKCADKMVNMMLASSTPHVNTHAICTGGAYDVALNTMFGVESDLVYHPELYTAFKRIKKYTSIDALNFPMPDAALPLAYRLADVAAGKLVELRKSALMEVYNKVKSNEGPLQELPLGAYVLLKEKGSERTLYNKIQELFMTAGHTVAAVLSNMTYFLAVLPDIQERVWQEQCEIFGNDKQKDPTIADLNQMQFLDRFIKESLRFLAPSVVIKVATGDINVDGITIPRDTIVVYLLKYIKFNPKYIKNPKSFDPDRFLDDNDELKYGLSSFGIGVRYCPGEYFAKMLMKITLSKLVRRLKLKPVDKDFRFEDMKFKSYLMSEVDNLPELKLEERA